MLRSTGWTRSILEGVSSVVSTIFRVVLSLFLTCIRLCSDCQHVIVRNTILEQRHEARPIPPTRRISVRISPFSITSYLLQAYSGSIGAWIKNIEGQDAERRTNGY